MSSRFGMMTTATESTDSGEFYSSQKSTHTHKTSGYPNIEMCFVAAHTR